MTRPSPNGQHPAIFLDRDGTLMRDVDYCGDPRYVEVFPGVPQALRRLKEAGFKLVVITNQSGIGRGYFTEAQYREVESELARQIGNTMIDATYFCPDQPGTKSRRRKPSPEMVLEAARDLDLDLPRSLFIGDKAIDIECGHKAGIGTILVQTGYGSRELHCEPDRVARDLPEAAAIILEHRQ